MSLRLASFFLAGVLLAGCGGGPARQARGGLPGGPGETQSLVAPDALLFVAFDADRDRQLTRAELDRGAAGEWAALAKGRDTLGHIELRDWIAAVLGGENFDFGPVGFDTNYDGKVSREEFVAALVKRFDALDADKNAVLSRAELVKRVPMRGGAGPREGGQGMMGAPPGGGRPPPQ